ncbi:MAG: hypothetical protein R3240_09870, partial [Gammaproteobacteria bacterium]|nr:hypothetical protein [Gammaproteobacteria bacterium]
ANGLNESIIDLNDASNSLVLENMLAYIPYFVHKHPKTAYVVGFGGGITTRAFTHTDVESIRVVELEPTVVEAGKQIKNGPVNALKDPRVHLEFNDARNTLLIEDKTYDIIAAQPSHPWRAGAANVFTQDFFELVYSRLNDDGIFSQWVNLFRMDVTTLKSLFKAFFNVFPQGFTMANLETGDLMMVGSKQPLKFDFQQIRERMQKPQIKALFKHYQVEDAEDLMWYFALSRDEAVAAAKNSIANTDRNIFTEVRLSSLVDEPNEDENPYTFLRNQFEFDILPYLKPENEKQELEKISQYFLKWNSPNSAYKAGKQLYKLDQAWGRDIKHNIYYWRYDWKGATDWYADYDDWMPQTRIRQLQIHLQLQEWDKAKQIVNNIKVPKWRRVAEALTLYYHNDLNTLANIAPQSDEERYWQLLGLANQDPVRAGEQLKKLVPKDTQSIPHILAMIRYYAASNQLQELDKWSQHLADTREKLLERYTLLTDVALEENNLDWNQKLIEKIISLKDDYDKLPQIMKKRQQYVESL